MIMRYRYTSLNLSIGRSATSLVTSAPMMATVCARLSERGGQLPKRTRLGGSEGVSASRSGVYPTS